MNNIKVSIITATLNSSEFIIRCLGSVESQRFADIEHIVVDGGSVDGTLDILRSRAGGARVVEAEGLGLYDSLNRGIECATGDIIGVLHSDDVFHDEDTITKVVESFSQFTHADAVIGDSVFFHPSAPNAFVRHYRSARFRPWMLRFGLMPSHTASFFKREVFQEVGSYDGTYRSAGDFEFFVRFFLIFKCRCVFASDVYVRMQTGGISSAGWRSYLRTTYEIVRGLKANSIFFLGFPAIVLRLLVKGIGVFFFRLQQAFN